MTDHQEEKQEESTNELDELKAKADEYLNGWKRAKADYLNYKKESEGKMKDMIQFANAKLISEIIPIYENFKLAIRHIPEEDKNKDWVMGFSHIKKQFQDFLESLGIKEIKTVGEKFNPEIHEALDSAENDEYDSDIIFEEISAGYTLHDKVLKPAQVKVTK